MKRYPKFFTLLLVLCFLLPPRVAAAQGAQPTQNASAVLELLQSDADRIVLELYTPDYVLEEAVGVDGPCQRILVEGLDQSATVGAPQVPLRVALLGVPAQADISIHVTPLESAQIANGFRPCPAPEAATEEGEAGLLRAVERDVSADPAVYGDDQLFPKQAAALHDAGFMRSQRLARVEIYPFQVRPREGALLHHSRVRIEVQFGAGSGAIASAAATENLAPEDAAFEQVLAGSLLNYATARSWRGAPLEIAEATAWRPPLNAYRVAVDKEGLYALSYEALAAVGLVSGSMSPALFHMHYDGGEIAIGITGAEDNSFDPGDQILFYGQAVAEKYTRTNIYWLSYGGQNGKRFALRNEAAPNAATVTSYLETVRHEVNRSYVSSLPKEPGYDHWYEGNITALGAGASAHKEITFALDQLAPTTASATLKVALAGNVKSTHHIRLHVNGTVVYDGSWVGRTYTTLAATFDPD
ncbi:MAG: hypothetical protein HC802_06235, partial [Caldilineaceae bacterium]|nr:hypothetical protein [Caldilineaceae bacterium]